MSLDFTLLCPCCEAQVFSLNITHNLSKMASAADLYQWLWKPRETGCSVACEIEKRIEAGLSRLRAEPALYKKFNPSNGWGNYENLVEFTETVLEAVRKHPTARLHISR